MEAPQGTVFECCVETGLTGLVGTISNQVIDNDGAVTIAASTAGIIETPAGSGNYCSNRAGIDDLGHYTIVWSTDGSYDENGLATDDLFIVPAVTLLPPLLPGGQVGGPTVGPCSAWTTTEDVAACCSAAAVGSDLDLLDDSVVSASQLLNALSAHQWQGVCTRVVRPCMEPCSADWWGGAWTWDGCCWSGNGSGPHCGCRPLSRVVLPNYAVTEIIEVVIDGSPLAASEYRLDAWSRLTRMRDADGNAQFWPSCQNLDADSSEVGTFEVTYAFGQAPPQSGIDAATELACQIFLACPREGVTVGAGECQLPAGVTRITRQGVTIEKGAFTAWGFVAASVAQAGRAPGWQTGLPLVDLFLNTYNPNGLRRRPMAWSPDAQGYAEEVGTA